MMLAKLCMLTGLVVNSLLPTDLWLRPAATEHLEALTGHANRVLPLRFFLAE